MTFSVFSENIRVYNAEQFINSVSLTSPTKIYLTFGKSTPWANNDTPTQANSSVTVFNDVWKSMIGAKLITGNDVRHVIPRNDWTSNTSYAMYDHCECSLKLFDPNVKFFVVTSDWNVYKCLSNNSGALSTVMPTQTIATSAVQESDGYVWKFMYSVSAEERLRFTTDKYIPVRTLKLNDNSLQWQVQQRAIVGGIEAIKILNPGTNYSNSSNINVTITGDGKDATAFATINTSSKTISQIVITNPGVNYTFANVTLTGGGGSGAQFKAMIPPPGGHGSDPVRELGGSYVLLNPRLINTEGGKIPAENEFRQVAIIQDPKERTSRALATKTNYSQTLRFFTSSGSTNYINDETVYQGPTLASAYFTGSVTSWDSANNIMRLTNVVGTPRAEPLIGTVSSASRSVESIIGKELLDYTGNLLYIDNITPIQRADDQTEDFKIVVKF